MRKEIPKNFETAEMFREQEAFYCQVKQIFESKGGIYGVALRKGILGNNLYGKIRRCAKGITKIQQLLKLVEHRLDWNLIDLKKEKSKT